MNPGWPEPAKGKDMSKKIWRLTVRDEISAGHALRHYEGKCERMHGHNFAVELTVEGDKLTENV